MWLWLAVHCTVMSLPIVQWSFLILLCPTTISSIIFITISDCLRFEKGGGRQGSTKLVLVVFKMPDQLKSHRPILVKITYKQAKTRPRMIKKSVCDGRRLPVTDRDCLWQTKTVCDKHRLSVTDTDCLWQTHAVCDRQCVTDANCQWQTQTLCDRHNLSLMDTDFL